MKTQKKIIFNTNLDEENFEYSIENLKPLTDFNIFDLKNKFSVVEISGKEKFTNEKFAEKQEKNYQLSHNDFSEVMNKRLDEYSDDEYSLLKKEIDSYINSNEDQKDINNNDLTKNINNNREFFKKEQCKNNFWFLFS